MESPQVARVILYVKDIPKVAQFYQAHFGLVALPGARPGWLELAPRNGGCSIALHQASAAQKRGSEIKIVFGVRDVAVFKKERESSGLKFGVVHEVGSFKFSNAKDPAGNSIQISSRGFT
jgi:predicted enzyme related to lactoylglutathione lyase